ncbi:MAG: GNAT family N-acetyltransferase [Chloroflexota bacterium]|nr:GNAT family N-acetyltransferase [Chloroflexota bacterium]MDE2683625.1 GNAT family N-acetyltransferase [Chloroflexota bacterium]
MQELRPITPDEFERWMRVESRAHGNRFNHDPEELRPHFDLDRSIAVLEDGKIVGGAHSHLLEMSVPGGVATVAGVSNVEVQPTHTRRGVMTRMMRYQLDGIHERGEPLAALFATESAIYGRFGYGVGSVHEWWSIEKSHNAYARRYESPGRIVFVDAADIGRELPEVFRRSTEGRPTVFQRARHHWERDSRDPIHSQGGPGGVFYAAYVENGRIDGYVNYRTQRPAVIVNELMAATREANAALWRFCFDLDLYERTEVVKRPVDDPMPWLLADPRRLQRSTRDGLWLRIVDVPAALQLRAYLANDRVTLRVCDDFCSWNDATFELDGSFEGAHCRISESSPELTVPVAALSSAYTGAATFTTLAQAGLVEEHTPGALLRADRMFAVQLKPWTPYNF